MLDQQTKRQFQQKWQQIKPRVKQQFSDLSDSDLERTQGDPDKLLSTIEQKTGKSRDQIEKSLKQLVSSS